MTKLRVFLWLVLAFISAAQNEELGTQLNVNPERDDALNGQSETLEEEMDNQENIMTQLLADYDKVKALSEGSDCTCKCVVRPLSRSACRRIEEDSAETKDFYTVETVTSGSDCKCACIAPPSALNPCEGDYRFKKLQDAGKDDIKISTIMDLLEGALYGMDLLKLHSVTTKLLNRVENIEKAVSQNQAEQKVSGSEDLVRTEVKQSRTHLLLDKGKHNPGLPLQRDAAGPDTEPKERHEEKFMETRGPYRPLLKRSHTERATAEDWEPEEPQKQAQARPGPNRMVIRGITYYKSGRQQNKDLEQHTTTAAAGEEVVSGDGSVDSVWENLHQKRKHTAVRANERGRLGPKLSEAPNLAIPLEHPKPLTDWGAGEELGAIVPPATTVPAITATTAPPSSITTSTLQTIAAGAAAATTAPETPEVNIEEAESETMSKQSSPTKPAMMVKRKYRISWTESPTEEPISMGPQKNPGECKDTLASISDPVTHNTYGRQEGAWMKDPKSTENKIYVTNYYSGNYLLEFKDLETFKKGQSSNSYKLPYNWIGTGHVVYNGAFFYNRAFSRDIIKYDLRMRYVAAWTILHNAAYEEDTPWQWRGHTNIDFAVDESGLWMIYPALDEEAFHQEVIVLSKVNPTDLSMQEETTWRTGLRKNFYGNCFVVCGVLYAVDSFDRAKANISYAFDTHTNTQMVPRLPFANSYSFNTQIDYNPKEKVLYSWDNGHQVTYNLVFAY